MFVVKKSLFACQKLAFVCLPVLMPASAKSSSFGAK